MQLRSHLALAGLVLALTTGLSAQNPPSTGTQAKSPPPCRNDRPVDEYIAEMNQAKKHRNKNPLPNSVCIGGWCKGSGEVKRTPPPLPPASHPPQPSAEGQTSESSSREATEPAASYDPFQAAQDVDVGDYYYSRENYRAALSRYQEGLESKPDDAAIYLRLGRTLEKLDEAERAYENYDATLVADPAGPFAEEARKSAARLRPEVEKRGGDPNAIAARNRARIVPRCRTEIPVPATAPAPPR